MSLNNTSVLKKFDKSKLDTDGRNMRHLHKQKNPQKKSPIVMVSETANVLDSSSNQRSWKWNGSRRYQGAATFECQAYPEHLVELREHSQREPKRWKALRELEVSTSDDPIQKCGNCSHDHNKATKCPRGFRARKVRLPQICGPSKRNQQTSTRVRGSSCASQKNRTAQPNATARMPQETLTNKLPNARLRARCASLRRGNASRRHQEAGAP